MANFTAIAKRSGSQNNNLIGHCHILGSSPQNVTLFTRPFLTESEHGLGMHETSATCVKLSVLGRGSSSSQKWRDLINIYES